MSRADARAAAPAGPEEVASARASPGGAPDDANDYQSQLAVVRALGAGGASADRLREAAERLRELKREALAAAPRGTAGRRKKRKAMYEGAGDADANAAAAAAARDAAATAHYPPRDPPPLDDQGFVLAFDVPSLARATDHDTPARGDTPRDAASAGASTSTAAASSAAASSAQSPPRHHSWSSFFRRYGFVVFRDALTPAECAAARDEIWTQIERAHAHCPVPVRRDRPETYGAMSSQTYGLAPEPAVFSPALVRNRQNPRALACLAATLGLDDPRDALVSQDRWCVYRPTRDVEVAPGETRDFPEWKTRGNLHLDLNPWTWGASRDAFDYADRLPFDSLRDFSKETNAVCAATGPHVQGVLALSDNFERDGGTVLVPGFHATFDEWSAALGPKDAYVDAHDDKRRNHLVWRGDGAGSFKFGDDDDAHRSKVRIPVREGSFLIWDQRVCHGSAPNDSNRARIAQFLKGFRRDGAGQGRLERRGARVKAELERAGVLGEVSALGRRVFGLDAVERTTDA